MEGQIRPLHMVTPLIPSSALTQLCDRQAFLKLENTQPSGSFKIRGIGHLIQKSKARGSEQVVSSSGGNAGMAAAYASRMAGLPATIVIPQSTPQLMISRLEKEKAKVLVHGRIWNEAHEKALEIASHGNSCIVHPYEHEEIWEGHSSMVTEILKQTGEKPSAIVLSVGGGGLLCGVLKGLHNHGLDIPVLAMETRGAHALEAALEAGGPVSIGDITSIAKSLGALSVTKGVFELKTGLTLLSRVITDKEAIEACVKFADDHRMLVEPACGAAMAAGYCGIIKEYIATKKIPEKGPVVFVVCGGNIVTTDMLQTWKQQFSLSE